MLMPRELIVNQKVCERESREARPVAYTWLLEWYASLCPSHTPCPFVGVLDRGKTKRLGLTLGCPLRDQPGFQRAWQSHPGSSIGSTPLQGSRHLGLVRVVYRVC